MNNKLLLFYLFLFLALVLRLFSFYTSQKTYQKGDYVEFTTQIFNTPKPHLYYQTIYVNIDAVNKVLVKTGMDKDFSYGDYVKFSGNLDELVLNKNTTIFTLNYPKITANFRENNPFLRSTYVLRQKIINNFKTNLDPISAGLLLGIVFGIKDNLPKDFLNSIQVTGVTHVIAASGMNVTMVSGLLFYLFGALFKRQTAIFLSIFGILFYTALAGFQASIIRAAIMGILVFSAQILGKQQYSFGILLLTAFGMLFVSPQFLVDTGFQLSFVATFGLLYIPDLFKRFKNSFTEDLITTISAQISTLPILLTNFGNFSLWSIATNALVLWTIPILMILGSIAAVFGFIFAPIGTIFLYLCLPFLYFFEEVVKIFAGFGTTVSLQQFPWQFIASYYLFLGSFVYWRTLRK